jgi:multiple sugar transport system substrate-binding protein
MVKWIRAFSVLLALVLTACGQDAAPNTPIPPATPLPTTGAVATPGATERGTLRVIWFDFSACHELDKLSKQFPGAVIQVRCVPIGQWHDEIFTDFSAKGGADIVVLDSQFIGEAVQGGHVLELTDWMKTHIDISDYSPTTLSAYGEYPLGSSKYYAIVALATTQMLVYRQDLFARADVQADFKAATGHDLAPPQTWTELLAIARFFKESNGKYGVANGYTTHWCGTPACYDNLATHWNQILWSWGGEMWDPQTHQIEGVLNSPAGVAALNFDRELFKTGPEGQASYRPVEAQAAVCSGTTAMATTWFAFGHEFADPAVCPQADHLTFGIVPGESRHFTSLGGQGLSVSAYSPNKQLALDYVQWFESKEIQLEWARRGSSPGRESVLASDVFKNTARYNPAFAESYQYVKDFWNVPEYNALLAVERENLGLAITGQKDPQAAMDDMARKQQEIMDAAYPDGPAKR